MTVGARFPTFTSPSPSPCPPPPAFTPSSSVLPVPPMSPLPPHLPSCLLPFPFPCPPCPYPYPFNPARESGVWGSAVRSTSGSGRSPAAKRFWCIFRLKSTHLFRFHNDTFVILLYLLAVYISDINKFPWGRLGGIAPSPPLPTTFWPWGGSPPWSRRLWPTYASRRPRGASLSVYIGLSIWRYFHTGRRP